MVLITYQEILENKIVVSKHLTTSTIYFSLLLSLTSAIPFLTSAMG